MAFAVGECAAVCVGHLNWDRSAGCSFKLGHPTYKTESLPCRNTTWSMSVTCFLLPCALHDLLIFCNTMTNICFLLPCVLHDLLIFFNTKTKMFLVTMRAT